MSNTDFVELVQNLIAAHKPGTDLQRTLRIACPWLHALSPADRARCTAEISAVAHDSRALRAELIAWEGSARAVQKGTIPGVSEWVAQHSK